MKKEGKSYAAMKTPNKYRKYIPWILAALVVLLSFLMSGMSSADSHSVSGTLTQRVIRFLRPLIDFFRESPDWQIYNETNFILRKAVHVITYFLLTLFISLGIRGITDNKVKVYVGACIAVLVIAAVDEFHQSFVAGRGASAFDVFIDMMGAASAFALVAVWRLTNIVLAWLRRGWPRKDI